MGLEELQKASERLTAAADETDDDEISDRLRTQADALGSLADGERGPDHGRLARHTHALQEIGADGDDDVAAAVEDALEHVRAYRSTVSGV
ncbi:MAG: hypothetical protein ABEJ80_04445 [Halarchaeum sp.]